MTAQPGTIYCSHHDTWHSPRSVCLHCVTAAQLNELRQTIRVLESRLVDAEQQAMQDRRRITALEHWMIQQQAAYNRLAHHERCNLVAPQ